MSRLELRPRGVLQTPQSHADGDNPARPASWPPSHLGGKCKAARHHMEMLNPAAEPQRPAEDVNVRNSYFKYEKSKVWPTKRNRPKAQGMVPTSTTASGQDGSRGVGLCSPPRLHRLNLLFSRDAEACSWGGSAPGTCSSEGCSYNQHHPPTLGLQHVPKAGTTGL